MDVIPIQCHHDKSRPRLFLIYNYWMLYQCHHDKSRLRLFLIYNYWMLYQCHHDKSRPRLFLIYNYWTLYQCCHDKSRQFIPDKSIITKQINIIVYIIHSRQSGRRYCHSWNSLSFEPKLLFVFFCFGITLEALMMQFLDLL